MIRLKSEREIDEMRYPNAVVGEVLSYIKEYVVEGVTTYDLNKLIEEFFKKEGTKQSNIKKLAKTLLSIYMVA